MTAVDYHTAGEPFRIVTSGAGALIGDSILEKRRYAAEHLDHIRKLLVYEPRGHADMYGCFVTEPEDDDGDLGVVFFHNAGYSTACGHGTIALATWAVEKGVVGVVEPETEIVIDVPSGRLRTTARVEKGRARSVRFVNVPSFVHSRGTRIEVQGRALLVDVSFGGAFYASVDAAALGVPVEPKNVNRFIALGRDIKSALEEKGEIVHPVQPELRDVYGVIFFEDLPAEDRLVQRNVTVFADGEVDRSPCGSGTSARLALLDESGELPRGDTLVHRSIVGSEFRAHVSGEEPVAGSAGVITEVEGSASLTGYHHFVLHDDDPLREGFLLR